MATKKEVLEEVARGVGCLGKAADDEPVFILRAKDVLAAEVVYEWARLAEIDCLHEREKVRDAKDVAQAMLDWRKAYLERQARTERCE